MSAAFAAAVAHTDFQQEMLLETSTHKVIATIVQQHLSSVFSKRVVPIEDHQFIRPLPAVSEDPVGNDIADIPGLMHHIQVCTLYCASNTLGALLQFCWAGSLLEHKETFADKCVHVLWYRSESIQSFQV